MFKRQWLLIISMQNHRPFGVTIIAILLAIGGIGSLLSGLTVLALIPILGIILAGVFFIIGIAYFMKSDQVQTLQKLCGYLSIDNSRTACPNCIVDCSKSHTNYDYLSYLTKVRNRNYVQKIEYSKSN